MTEDTKKCSRCGRELPLDRFTKGAWCKNCMSTYTAKIQGIAVSEKNSVKIKRAYKKPNPKRILDIKDAGIELLNKKEYFVELINYKKAWISNYGRVLEHNNGKYVFKRLKKNGSGELICTLQKNVYADKKWVYQKQTIEVWRLVVSAFIVNYDIAGNTCCWHKANDKSDNYFKNIYPMTEKQYIAVQQKYMNGEEDSREMIFNVINDILYKDDDWYANKWKKTFHGIGYLGCNDAHADGGRYIYDKWANMMQRCYDKNVHKYKPYYAPCTVDPEWHNFSNYRQWHLENAMGDYKVDLDKDILIPGNTVYSSETCTLVPHFTNTIFEERGSETSVVQNNDTGKYDASMSIMGKRKDIGSYNTEEEAKQAYVDYKQDYIVKFAKKSKGKVPQKTYQAMLNWTVKIDD